MSPQPLITVTDVEVPDYAASLLDIELSRPEAGERAGTYALAIQGEAKGKGRELREIRLCTATDLLATAANSPEGFETRVNALRLPQDFELRLNAVFDDGVMRTIALIRGSRAPLPVATDQGLAPILVTSLGRAGSTWVTHLLAQHEQVVGFHPFWYEARLSTYWLEVLATLAEPDSYFACIRGGLSADASWWSGGRQAAPALSYSPAPGMEQWLGGANVRAMAASCADRIGSFWTEAAGQQGKVARHFVEKGTTSQSQDLLWELYPAGREVVLVRDFRDVICSMYSYSRRKEGSMFGIDRVQTPADFVRQFRDEAKSLHDRWQQRTERTFLLRYEDLVSDPGTTVASLFGSLGLGGAEEAERTLSAAAATETEVQQGHRTAPSAEQSIGRWKTEMGTDLRGACERELGEFLEAFGYPV